MTMWKPVSGADGYEVSDDGLIRSHRSWRGSTNPRLLNGHVDSSGYRRVNLTGRGQCLVHSLIAEAFLGRSDGEIVHIDGDRLNNAASNLEVHAGPKRFVHRPLVRDDARHGTIAGYAAHRRQQIPMCAECLAAKRDQGRELRSAGISYLNWPKSMAYFHARTTVSENGCWLWNLSTVDGYGRIGPRAAHRVAWELANGPIPEGLHIDHVCHTEDSDCPGGEACSHRRCVNPEHLEPVTQTENNLRAKRRIRRAS